MESLFGVSMDSIMRVVLTGTIIVLLVVAFLAWRRPILARLALRNIPRRRAQTVLIVFGLMLATLLITAAFGTGDTMTYSMRQAFTASLGGTDIQIQKANPQPIAVSGPPDFNRPVPTFSGTLLNDIKAKVGDYSLIDGWALSFQQLGPVIDKTTNQASGQTFIEGIGPDSKTTRGNLQVSSGGVFDAASLKEGDILLDQSAADKLGAHIGDDISVVVAGKQNAFKVREIVTSSSPSNQFPVTFVTFARAQEIYNAPGQVTSIDVSLKGGNLNGVTYSKEVSAKLQGLLDKSYEVNEAKRDALTIADRIGSITTTGFVGTSMFSIAAGILLIFLIFSMLAAERKSEMGMARAVGTQRGHLTQMFIFEGLAYDLVAAGVGAALGVGVGLAMVSIISAAFGTFGFSLTAHVELRSIIVAYCLGMLITFLTVAISAGRVSRLNIVAAIRDIPDMPRPDRTIGEMLREPVRQLVRERSPLGALRSVFALLFSLFRSGPLTVLLGILLMSSGWQGKNGFAFHTGSSIAIIGAGLTLRWILGQMRVRPTVRDRIAFTTAGIMLLIYWALPLNALHDWFGVPDFGLGIEIFFVGGIMMVAGAVWAIIYNADILLAFLSFALGRLGRMRPILKTAVAYPMSSIFRTGLTLAMFALIIFTLIVISVFNQTSSQVDPNKPEVAGGYQIEAPVSYSNPIADIKSAIAANPNLNGKFESVTGQTLVPLEMRQPGGKPPALPYTANQLKAEPGLAEGWHYYSTRLVDQDFLNSNRFPLQIRAKGYNSDREVWEAISKDPTLTVIDSVPVAVGRQGSPGGFGPPLFYITGVDTEVPTMDPVNLEVRLPVAPSIPGATGAAPAGVAGAAGPTMHLKIIGVMSRLSNFYPGLYASAALAKQISPVPLPVGTYFFRAKPGESPETLRRALGSTFINNGMEPVVISAQIQKQLAAGQSLYGLLQGFMFLGLLVGIAALGVISTRAVVERRQQIGVLRAIGYQKGMISASFLFESSFVALLGILIGVGLGLVLSFNLVTFLQKQAPTIQFDPPWVQIVVIVVLSYLASLVTTVLPARQASQIYPAEALRYE